METNKKSENTGKHSSGDQDTSKKSGNSSSTKRSQDDDQNEQETPRAGKGSSHGKDQKEGKKNSGM